MFPDPGEPQPTLVAPGVGLTGIHPVGASKLDTAVNGRDLAVRVSWYGGVEPCSVLAGVDVARDGNTFTLTVREGSAAAPDTACIEIALYKGTIVDLGELEPGTYTITAFGDAPPVTVTHRLAPGGALPPPRRYSGRELVRPGRGDRADRRDPGRDPDRRPAPGRRDHGRHRRPRSSSSRSRPRCST